MNLSLASLPTSSLAILKYALFGVVIGGLYVLGLVGKMSMATSLSDATALGATLLGILGLQTAAAGAAMHLRAFKSLGAAASNPPLGATDPVVLAKLIVFGVLTALLVLAALLGKADWMSVLQEDTVLAGALGIALGMGTIVNKLGLVLGVVGVPTGQFGAQALGSIEKRPGREGEKT